MTLLPMRPRTLLRQSLVAAMQRQRLYANLTALLPIEAGKDDWWRSLTDKQQQKYMQRHKRTKFKKHGRPRATRHSKPSPSNPQPTRPREAAPATTPRLKAPEKTAPTNNRSARSAPDQKPKLSPLIMQSPIANPVNRDALLHPLVPPEQLEEYREQQQEQAEQAEAEKQKAKKNGQPEPGTKGPANRQELEGMVQEYVKKGGKGKVGLDPATEKVVENVIGNPHYVKQFSQQTQEAIKGYHQKKLAVEQQKEEYFPHHAPAASTPAGQKWWNSLSYGEQVDYLKNHPDTKYKLTKKPSAKPATEEEQQAKQPPEEATNPTALKHGEKAAGGPGGGTPLADELRPDAEEQKVIQQQTHGLLKAFKDFNLPIEELDPSKIQVGPSVIRYRVRLKPGARVGALKAVEEDLGRELALESPPMVSTIPGENYVAVDVPRPTPKAVPLGKAVKRLPDQKPGQTEMPIALGVTPDGRMLNLDITEAPHMLVAGATQSGKSVFLNSMLTSLMSKMKPHQLECVIVDPKQTDFAAYNGSPYLRNGKVITDAREAIHRLKDLSEREMDARTAVLKKAGAMNIKEYNKAHPDKPMRQMMVMVDEYADLMDVMDKKERAAFEHHIIRLGQRARSVGIHLVIATQRPTSDIVTGTLKANLPTRISFQLPSQVDSRAVLDRGGAENLLGKGDMLVSRNGKVSRLQGYYMPSDELHKFLASKKKDEKPITDKSPPAAEPRSVSISPGDKEEDNENKDAKGEGEKPAGMKDDEGEPLTPEQTHVEKTLRRFAGDPEWRKALPPKHARTIIKAIRNSRTLQGLTGETRRALSRYAEKTGDKKLIKQLKETQLATPGRKTAHEALTKNATAIHGFTQKKAPGIAAALKHKLKSTTLGQALTGFRGLIMPSADQRSDRALLHKYENDPEFREDLSHEEDEHIQELLAARKSQQSAMIKVGMSILGMAAVAGVALFAPHALGVINEEMQSMYADFSNWVSNQGHGAYASFGDLEGFERKNDDNLITLAAEPDQDVDLQKLVQLWGKFLLEKYGQKGKGSNNGAS